MQFEVMQKLANIHVLAAVLGFFVWPNFAGILYAQTNEFFFIIHIFQSTFL